MKRFAEHDSQMIVINIEDPAAGRKLVCSRCGHEEPISSDGPGRSPLYEAVRSMAQVPCALADLDEQGYLITMEK